MERAVNICNRVNVSTCSLQRLLAECSFIFLPRNYRHGSTWEFMVNFEVSVFLGIALVERAVRSYGLIFPTGLTCRRVVLLERCFAVAVYVWPSFSYKRFHRNADVHWQLASLPPGVTKMDCSPAAAEAWLPSAASPAFHVQHPAFSTYSLPAPASPPAPPRLQQPPTSIFNTSNTAIPNANGNTIFTANITFTSRTIY